VANDTQTGSKNSKVDFIHRGEMCENCVTDKVECACTSRARIVKSSCNADLIKQLSQDCTYVDTSDAKTSVHTYGRLSH